MSQTDVLEAAAAVRAAEERIFVAIRTRDVAALDVELAPDFVLSSPGNADQERHRFLEAIADMPYRIVDLHGEDLGIRILDATAIVSGIQRARVALADDSVVYAATAFVDVFVRVGDAWRLRHAVSIELPSAAGDSR